MFELRLLEYPVLVVHELVRLFAIRRIPGVHITQRSYREILRDVDVGSGAKLELHGLKFADKPELALEQDAQFFVQLNVRSPRRPLDSLRYLLAGG